MRLTDAASGRYKIYLVCNACGAWQPVSIDALIERHSPDTGLDVAIRLHRCLFCEERGRFETRVLDRWS